MTTRSHTALIALTASLLCLSLSSAAAASCLHTPTSPSVYASDHQYYQWFKDFQTDYGKTYGTEEEAATRFAVFRDNVALILAHQLQPNQSYSLAVNQFADLTHEEFRRSRNGFRHVVRPYLTGKNTAYFDEAALNAAPDSVNWTAAGKVTPVKNQEQCGSCWSFSTTGSVEAAYAIENNASKLISLSEQELVDCSSAEGNSGCAGGLMDQAFEFIIKNKGLCTEQAYPYVAADGSCTESKCTSAVTIAAYSDVPQNNEPQLQAAVAQQPVSVAVDASAQFWQFYSGGVAPASQCGTQLDHGVLATGFGTLNGKPYWIVKNSWGTEWGVAGYILLERGTAAGSPGACGIAMMPSYPTGVTAVAESLSSNTVTAVEMQ